MEVTIELLSTLVNEHKINELKDIFANYNIVDLAEMVGELDIREALFIFKVIPNENAGDLFSYLSSEKQEKLVELLTGNELKSILDDVYSDDIADFLDELPRELSKKILASISKDQREEINQLLSYKDNSCGSIMGIDYVELDPKDTIAQAMEEIKEQEEIAESISYCYVTDNGKLVGDISLRDVILLPDDALLKDEMETDIVSAKTTDDQEVAIELIKKYDMTMLPIVDENDNLVGVIMADDIVDAIEAEVTEDIHKMAAVVPVQTGYLQTSPLKIALNCLPWLMVLMISGGLSEGVIASNSSLILLYPVLSNFIPMLMDTAGNAGSQASSMVIRGIVVDKMDMHCFFKVLRKEFFIALVCGGCLFITNMIRLTLIMRNVTLTVALISSGTLFLVIVMAKLVGGVLPLLASAIKLDPTVMASPLITTICDTVSLLIYFGLGRILL